MNTNEKRPYIKTGLTNKKGIYKILNKSNQKFYIGSTLNLNRRWWEHKKFLKINIHCNKHLQNAYNKYGKDNFRFIVEEILPDHFTEEQVLEIEQAYLDKFWDNGKDCYNASKVADKPDCNLNKIPVNQIDKITGNVIKTWSSA